ncbi:hypothetical protein D3C74_147330 [compost metagenome]
MNSSDQFKPYVVEIFINDDDESYVLYQALIDYKARQLREGNKKSGLSKVAEKLATRVHNAWESSENCAP